ncbi:MAG: adenylate cyclase [Bdellovibrionaceae bacterium]|nr:adenylate cyclase [Pseudobdellovibrionaceae bacterium]
MVEMKQETPPSVSAFEEIRRKEKLDELKAVLETIGNKMVFPLYFAFWVADVLYVPHLKWEFLALRATIIPTSLVALFFMRRTDSSEAAEYITICYAAGVALPITIMTIMSGGQTSLYYAGLNLVAVGALSFPPLRTPQFLLALIGVFLPFYIGVLLFTDIAVGINRLVINSFFVVGTVTICFLIRHFNEKLRLSEIRMKLNLQDELVNRENIILQKTEEGIKLRTLSNQFSPQVVHAIKNNEIDIEGRVHSGEICCIFIDIVNSTERVANIDASSVDKVISMFMEDAIKVLLKYDITVDKFLGDGILAFCNDPIKYSDYHERVVHSALEIIEKISSRSDEYQSYWLKDLEVSIGIASGSANIGFYGSSRYFKSYTAIGPVVNLASRLCSEARPNQILVSSDVVNKLVSSEFEVKAIGERTLKGFEGEIHQVYEITGCSEGELVSFDIHDCPKCNSILHLTTDDEGIYLFSCRECGFQLDDIADVDEIPKAS